MHGPAWSPSEAKTACIVMPSCSLKPGENRARLYGHGLLIVTLPYVLCLFFNWCLLLFPKAFTSSNESHTHATVGVENVFYVGKYIWK